MKVGVIILNYNSWELTKSLAKCVSEYEKVDDVVIVDNASSDDSYVRLSEIAGGKVHLIQSGCNGGYSFGNNIGAKFCNNLNIDVCMISNPDVIIEEEDVNRIIDVFLKSDYSMLSGVQCDINGIPCSPLSRINDYWDDLRDCSFLWRKLHKSIKQNDECVCGRVQNAEKLDGSFFAFRLKDFLEVGGFDENIFLYCEERILGRRFCDAGKKIGLVKDAKYIHCHSVSIDKVYKEVAPKMKLLYKSRLYFQQKYNHIGTVKSMLFLMASGWSLFEFMCRDFFRRLKDNRER